MGQYAQQLIRHLPLADLDDEFVAWYLHARGLLRPRRFFADVRARNLTEKASRFPARIFQPASNRLGVPRVEWLVDFDLFVATNFLAPATRHPIGSCRSSTTSRSGTSRSRRRTSTTVGVGGSRQRSTDRAGDHRAFDFGGRRSPRHLRGRRRSGARRASRRRCGGVRPGSAGRGRRRPASLRDPRRYVLFVGGIEPRKNLERLVRAFAKSDARHLSLVIAGGPVRWFPEAAERLDATIGLLPRGCA